MTSLRLWLLLAAALALGAPVAAQPVGSPQNITVVDSGTACVTAPTACATYALDSSTGSLSISVSGTWTGTLTFEGSNANGVFTSLLATNLATGAQATTTTASGLFTVTNAGVITVRVRATAAITGTAIVTAAKGLGFARASGALPTAGVLTFGSPSDTGLSRAAAGIVAVGNGTQGDASGTIRVATVQVGAAGFVLSGTSPTVSSGFGTSAALQAVNGPAAFALTVGTGGVATAGVIGLPTAAGGWTCNVFNATARTGHRADNTVQTANTVSSVTFENQTTSTGAAVAWTASDQVRANCFPF